MCGRLCSLPLVHLCEWQHGVLEVKNQQLSLGTECAVLWGPVSDRIPPKASASVPPGVQALGFRGAVPCEWGYVSLTYRFSAWCALASLCSL